MKFPEPLIPGYLVRRHKRFLADVELENGEAVTVHCPNPGSMLGLDAAGSGVCLSPALSPSRKLRYTLELVRAGAALVGVNTNLANRVAEEAVGAGRIRELAGYRGLRREVRYGMGSRVNLLLEEPGRPTCFVEVKSVTLRRNMEGGAGVAEFPDAVAAPGTLGSCAAWPRRGCARSCSSSCKGGTGRGSASPPTSIPVARKLSPQPA